MEKGFSILVWDHFGEGLVKVNPKLLHVGKNMYGNNNNWFPYHTEAQKESLISKLTRDYKYFKVIE